MLGVTPRYGRIIEIAIVASEHVRKLVIRMKVMRKAVLCVVLSCIPLHAKAPFTFDAMMQLARIDDAQLSRDGKLVAFSVQTIDMSNNARPTQIYVVPVDGGPPRQITHEGGSNTRPRWTPDSKRIFFISDRTNGSQVWSMSADGSGPKQITNLPTGADGVTLSPDGKLMVFTSDVYPGCEPGGEYDAACNKKNLDDEQASKMKARVFTGLFYRHWTQYQGRRRKHILTRASDGSGMVKDLTPGDLNVPPFALAGPEPYVFSPDNTQVTYVANTDPDLSISTNSDLFTISVNGGTARRMTTNPGADEGPVYSPDGKYLAYRTQIRSGYESDRWRLAVLDLASGQMNTLADNLDRWVEFYTWSPDSKSIFFTIDDHGTTPLLMIPIGGGPVRTVAGGPTSIGSVQFTPDNKVMIYTDQSGSRPVEINKALSTGGSGTPLTHLNNGVLNAYQLTPLETIWVDGGGGDKIESFLVKPPDFNPARKYPVLFAIHGGPEGDWGESWSYRWNAQVLAGAGYVVILPNPHGSVGYGQAFTDAVNGDWGGKPYDDIMATVDYVGHLPYVDPDRMVAAGASYGGYMIDWILGHTDRFRALVSHAGVYDLRSEAGTTEELWFPRWEFRGFPWENPEMYQKWSPSSYVKKFKTPTLVTQGEIDFRVPLGQSQQLFTALQQMHIASKLIQFPEEGHWIVKPQDSRFWYSAVLDWLNHYTAR